MVENLGCSKACEDAEMAFDTPEDPWQYKDHGDHPSFSCWPEVTFRLKGGGLRGGFEGGLKEGLKGGLQGASGLKGA